MAWKAHTFAILIAAGLASGSPALAGAAGIPLPATDVVQAHVMLVASRSGGPSSGRGIGATSRSNAAPKGLGRGPSFGETVRRGSARQRPYPDQFGADTSRGNYGCHRLGKRAIDTDNTNWWVRYKSCKSVGSD
jgi:hypothetical protein